MTGHVKDSVSDRYSKLLLELETDCGTTDLTTIVFKTLLVSIQNLKVTNLRIFKEELDEIYKKLSHTKPRFGIINYYLNQLRAIWEGDFADKEELRDMLVENIKKNLEEIQKNKQDVLNHVEELNTERKTILIYDHSHTIHNILEHLFKEKQQKFKVIIGEQDYQKTHENIEVLHQIGIPFQVVPDYMLCHIHENIDMVFLGATTLKDTMTFVMDPGTYGLVSQFNSFNIPCYLFCCTNKFSLWNSKHQDELSFKKDNRLHPHKSIEYERLKYSHDRVNAEKFTAIVTDEGIFTPQEIKKLFKHKFEAFGHE